MQHLCQDPDWLPSPRRFRGVLPDAFAHVKPGKGSSRSLELSHILHRLCEPPSIPLSFSLATILPRRSTSRFRCGREPIGEPPTQCSWFTARTTGVSNPVRSPGFRVSASGGVQGRAFAAGVPHDLNAFHRSTVSSRPPYPPPARSYHGPFPG